MKPPSKTQVALVVPTSSAGDALERFLDSCHLAATSIRSELEIEIQIVVVDNASEPAVAERLAGTIERYGHIRVLRLLRPSPLPAVVRAGLTHASADLYLVWTRDTPAELLIELLREIAATQCDVLLARERQGSIGACVLTERVRDELLAAPSCGSLTASIARLGFQPESIAYLAERTGPIEDLATVAPPPSGRRNLRAVACGAFALAASVGGWALLGHLSELDTPSWLTPAWIAGLVVGIQALMLLILHDASADDRDPVSGSIIDEVHRTRRVILQPVQPISHSAEPESVIPTPKARVEQPALEATPGKSETPAR